tara:strand:- start:1667 stop:2041 length:375 start_codon:yes stop_codon:yes gene_type:complete
METAFVLQLRDEGCFVRYANGNFGELSLNQVWNVIDGPTQTETEDLAHTTLKVEAENSIASQNLNFAKGDVVTWKVQVNQADLDVKGVVLSSNSHFTTASEWGCGVPERLWVLPTFMLQKSTRY